jgi:hypothetical protein
MRFAFAKTIKFDVTDRSPKKGREKLNSIKKQEENNATLLEIENAWNHRSLTLKGIFW